MKKVNSLNTFKVFLVAISFITALNGQTHDEEGHTHYVAHDSIAAHKLIFPSKTPDRVIANLTVDPAHSIAVNWRTNQQVVSGLVEIALATDGPEFLLRDVRKVKAVSQQFENQNSKEPLVKATFHSAVISDLQPNTSYVYRVGNGAEDNGYWSEWFQTTTAHDDMDAPFSFIYFGDAPQTTCPKMHHIFHYRNLPNRIKPFLRYHHATNR